MNQLINAKEELFREQLGDLYYYITQSFNSIHEFLLEVGTLKRLYSTNQLMVGIHPTINRYVECNGIKKDEVNFNNHGEFITHINRFNRPWITKTHSFRIEKRNDKPIIYTYGPTINFKALMFLYGEELLDYLSLSNNEKEGLIDSLRRRREDYAIDSSLSNVVFNGNAGSAVIDSASNYSATSYNVSVLQPPIINNLEFIINDNFHASCGCESWNKSNNVQREYENKIELCKHLTAFFIGLRKGRLFLESRGHQVNSIERPEGVSVNNIPILTLYSPLEDALMSDGSINPIFSEINSLIARKYYLNNEPMRSVDWGVLNKYGELILTPLLHFLLVSKQVSFNERLSITRIKSGEYRSASLINMPLPVARIVSNNSDYLLYPYPTRFKKK